MTRAAQRLVAARLARAAGASGPLHALIAGVSARAMAESAVRAGYRVSTVDAYADLDLAAIAVTTLVAPYTASAAVAAASLVAADIVCYVSNFENHPDAVRRLARGGRVLCGNTSATIAAARAPTRLARAFADAEIAAPRVRATAPRPGTAAAACRWLLKPRASGGGHGIAHWHPGRVVPRRCVLQERIAGPVGSIIFAADGRRCIPLGLTRQVIGDRRFAAPPFRYCGNILARADDPTWGQATPLARGALAAASAVTRAFGLVGVNGIDFVVRGGRSVPIEVNPRFTAAMELVERRDGCSIFATHVAGCTLALDTVVIPPPGAGAVGKALVFAHRAVAAGDTGEWLADPNIRDVPRPGTHIPAGAPICTVFAAGSTSSECYDALVGQAERVYERVGGR